MQVLNTKVPIPCSLIYKSYLTFLQSSVEKVFTCLYPRIFSLHNLDIYSENCPGRQITDDQWSAAILPKNLQASAKVLEDSGVYLVDNGEQFLVAVNTQTEEATIQNVDNHHKDLRSRKHHRLAADLRARGSGR